MCVLWLTGNWTRQLPHFFSGGGKSNQWRRLLLLLPPLAIRPGHPKLMQPLLTEAACRWAEAISSICRLALWCILMKPAPISRTWRWATGMGLSFEASLRRGRPFYLAMPSLCYTSWEQSVVPPRLRSDRVLLEHVLLACYMWGPTGDACCQRTSTGDRVGKEPALQTCPTTQEPGKPAKKSFITGVCTSRRSVMLKRNAIQNIISWEGMDTYIER